MLTGTPLDLTPFGIILQGIGLLYWLVLIAIVILILVKVKDRTGKIACIALTLTLMVGPLVLRGWLRYEESQAAKEKLDVAKSRFFELCKGAGEKIYRTVDDVEGIRILNVRAEITSSSMYDRNWPDAGLPGEGHGDWYLLHFLMWEHHEDKRSPRGYLNATPTELNGYRFVDVAQSDGSFLRYKLVKPEDIKLSKELVQDNPVRYAVSFENYVDPEDRKKWIAGTKVTITDTLKQEKVAEKTWYSMEPGQGSTVGFRTPWGYAQICPKVRGSGAYATRHFVDQVLKPKKAD